MQISISSGDGNYNFSIACSTLKFIAMIARRRLFYFPLNIAVGGKFLNIASILGPNKKSVVQSGAEIYEVHVCVKTFPSICVFGKSFHLDSGVDNNDSRVV